MKDSIDRAKHLVDHHQNHHHLSLLSPQPPPCVTIIITTTTICHYHHHNHHHLSPSSSQPPPSVTIIITTTTICHYHHHNNHMREGWGKQNISQNGKIEDRGFALRREMCMVLFAVLFAVFCTALNINSISAVPSMETIIKFDGHSRLFSGCPANQ